MRLLLDIGNTHTHLGLADAERVRLHRDIPTAGWFDGAARRQLAEFVGGRCPGGAALCSVVPRATTRARQTLAELWHLNAWVLSARTLRGLEIDYPQPGKIGADRLANAVALLRHFGAPAIAVDFGTAVTFDVVNRAGHFAGGIIAPGLSAMTDYLHERTALLPRIRIREVRGVIGRSTEEAMLIGAVHGYRNLVNGLLTELKRTLRCRRLPVVATGGCARLLASKVPAITAVEPLLTLEGLRLACLHAEPQQPQFEP